MDTTYTHKLEALIFDILDGQSPYDIRYMTGLSHERCNEIYELGKTVAENYLKRNGA